MRTIDMVLHFSKNDEKREKYANHIVVNYVKRKPTEDLTVEPNLQQFNYPRLTLMLFNYYKPLISHSAGVDECCWCNRFVIQNKIGRGKYYRKHLE